MLAGRWKLVDEVGDGLCESFIFHGVSSPRPSQYFTDRRLSRSQLIPLSVYFTQFISNRDGSIHIANTTNGNFSIGITVFLGHRLGDDLIDLFEVVSVRPSERPQKLYPISM